MSRSRDREGVGIRWIEAPRRDHVPVRGGARHPCHGVFSLADDEDVPPADAASREEPAAVA